ncbi:MAG: AsmA-like C-terminal domain-containing protein [Alphaproteobacteria bacterium]|nr:AsmA-like C-terminal domain-containing protein [Alphaproteobacteria bacterium]
MSLSEAWNASFIGRYVKSHHISRTALVGAALGVAVLFFVVGAALRLLVGPISLGPLSGQISDALAQALPGITIKYDQAAIEWSRSQGRVNLVVIGARVFDSRGRIIAQAPQADIDLAAQPFIQGKIVVRRVTLVGVQLTLVRTTDGTLRLGVEHDDSQEDIVRRITDAINKNNTGATSLQSFAIRDARVAFMDQNTGLFLVAPRAAVRIATSAGNLIAALEADVEVSGRAAHITGQLALPPQEGPVNGEVHVSHLDIAALGRNAKMFNFLRSIGMLADFNAKFAIEGTHLLRAQFGVDGKGTAAFVGIRKPMHIDKLHLAARYDRNTARINVDDATLDSDQMRAHIVGKADLVYDSSGAISRLGIDLVADKTALQVPGTFQQPVFLPLVTFHGGYVPSTHDILISHLNTNGGALVLDTSGKITLVDNKSPALDIKGRIEMLSVRDLLHYWPLGLGEGARSWIDANIFSGSLGPLVFETHLPAGVMDEAAIPDGGVLMTFPLVNVEANYVKGLTHIINLYGTATLTGNSFRADMPRARIGPLALSNGHAVIPNLSAPASPGDITAHVEGSVTDLLKLTDLKPLNYPTRFGITPETTAGKAAVDLNFHVPMLHNLSVDDVGIGIKVATTGFGISLGNRVRLAEGAVVFDIDNTHLHAVGTGNLASSRLSLDWTELFKGGPGVNTTKVLVKGALDQAGREMLGIAISDFVRGPVGINGTLTGARGQLTGADMNLDFTPASLSLDLVGISKPAGVAASGHSVSVFGPKSAIRTNSLTIAGTGLQATVNMQFSEDGELAVLTAPSLKSGNTNDFSLTMTRGPAGQDIAIRGRSIDGTQLARRGSNTGKGSGGPAKSDATFDGPFHINAKLDRVALRNGVTVAPFALDVTGVADRPITMSLSGSLGRSALSGSIVPAGNDRKLTLSAADMGTLARGMFGFASMKGGKLELTASLHGSGNVPAADDATANDYEGLVRLKDFRLLNQPFLARLFSAGSLIGFSNLLQNNGIAVDELKVPFSANNGVLALHDARATGPAIGISAEGYIDRPKNLIALKGTLVPLFGLNSVLGVIPLVGDLLISKPGEGIIGMTYTVSGDADEPHVSINPLSLATPGILRRIFEGKMPNAANAPSNAVPPVATSAPPVKPEEPPAPKP